MDERSSDDLSSKLPEEIVQQIIGHLPLEDAVRTSVLSRLWRSRWKPSVVRLNFNADPLLGWSQQVTRAITAFLASDDRSLKLCSPADELISSEKVIVLANKVVGAELHLNFPTKDFLSTKRVFKLVLVMTDSPSAPHLTHNFLASLKILRMESITSLSKDVVREFFSSCSCLQSLSLAKCSGMKSLDIEANDCFKSFEMLDCPDITHILISATNLESFCYRGFMPASIQVQNAEFLVTAVLDFRKGLGTMFDCEAVLSLLEDIKTVKSLTISGGCVIEWLCSAGVIFERLGFQLDGLKELRLIFRTIDEQKMNSIDCFLKIAPALWSLSVEIDPSYDSVPCPAFHHFWHQPHS